MSDPQRSGIGRFSRRKDIAALAIVFCFGALMNAFGMVSPVYAVEDWLEPLAPHPAARPRARPAVCRVHRRRTGAAARPCCMDHPRMGRSQARLARHRRSLRLRACAARLRHVAGALRLPLLYRPLHHRSRDAKRARRIWAGRSSANRSGRWSGCPKPSSSRWSSDSCCSVLPDRCWLPGAWPRTTLRSTRSALSLPGQWYA